MSTMNLDVPLAAPSRELRFRFVFAFEIERHGGADEVLQCGLINLVTFVNVDRASHIPIEAGIE